MGTTLVVNPGSSSKKYALFADGRSVAEYRFERTGAGYEVCSSTEQGRQVCTAISADEYQTAITTVVHRLETEELAPDGIARIGIRVVAPGTYFQRHQRVTDEYIERLAKRSPVAPLHIPVVLEELQQIRVACPQIPLVALSDSAFHAKMPPQARQYSINSTLAEEADLYRFGYHGISVASIVARAPAVLSFTPKRLVVSHIGSGVSVTAVHEGVGVWTSMGFDPSSGVLMGTRAGDMDAGAVLALMRHRHWRPLDAQTFLQTSGGLRGSADSADIRTLLHRRSRGDVAATAALAAFAFQIQSAIATATVALGGLDALVLTATAAERSSEVRADVVAGVAHLGMDLAAEQNDQLSGMDGLITTSNSAVPVAVIRTDELGMLAQLAAEDYE